LSTKIKMLVKFQTTILLSIIVLMIFFSNPLSFAESIEIVIPEGASQPGCEESNSCFIPYEVTITAGDSITWINQDSSPHTVTAGDLFKDVDIIGLDYPNGFSSPLLGSGDSWTHTFDALGTYPYFSMVGLWMCVCACVYNICDVCVCEYLCVVCVFLCVFLCVMHVYVCL